MLKIFNRYLDKLISKKLADQVCSCQNPIQEEEKITNRTYVKKNKLKNNISLDHNEYLKRTSIIWGVLAEYITDLRIKAKMNQRKLAKKLNISPAQVSRLEAGKIAVTNEMAAILDEIFNVNIRKIWDFPNFEDEKVVTPQSNDEYRISFGKFIGKTASEVPIHYARWLKENGTFKKDKNQELYKALIKAGKL